MTASRRINNDGDQHNLETSKGRWEKPRSDKSPRRRDHCDRDGRCLALPLRWQDCCCSIVTSIADAFTDPHYVARGVFHHVLANPEGATMPAQLRGWQWVTGTVSG